MIKNEYQYGVTRKQAQLIEKALASFSVHGTAPSDPIKAAQRDALQSQLADLQRELHEYEFVSKGVTRTAKRPLSQLAEAMIEARIASGLNQKDLAARLDMKEQQIQRYEATDYSTASLARILDVVDELEDYSFTFQIERRNVTSVIPPAGSMTLTGIGLIPIEVREPPLAAYATAPWAIRAFRPDVSVRVADAAATRPDWQGAVFVFGTADKVLEHATAVVAPRDVANTAQEGSPAVWMVGNRVSTLPYAARGPLGMSGLNGIWPQPARLPKTSVFDGLSSLQPSG